MKKKIVIIGSTIILLLLILLVWDMFRFWSRFDKILEKIDKTKYIEIVKEKTYMEITEGNLSGNDIYEVKENIDNMNSIKEIINILKNNYETDEKAKYPVNETTPKPYEIKCFDDRGEHLLTLKVSDDYSIIINDASLIKKRKITKKDYESLISFIINN